MPVPAEVQETVDLGSGSLFWNDVAWLQSEVDRLRNLSQGLQLTLELEREEHQAALSSLNSRIAHVRRGFVRLVRRLHQANSDLQARCVDANSRCS